MKAYFIDAWSETITEVDTKGYDNTRKLIRAKMIECYPYHCLLYTSPSPRDVEESRMPSSA